jgi:hypothetical protein
MPIAENAHYYQENPKQPYEYQEERYINKKAEEPLEEDEEDEGTILKTVQYRDFSPEQKQATLPRKVSNSQLNSNFYLFKEFFFLLK